MNIRAFALSPMVIALGLTVGLTGCSDSNSVSRVSPPAEAVTTPKRVDLAEGTYFYQLVFEDVATGKPINEALQVTLTGPAVDAGLVVDANNTSLKGKTLTTDIGTVTVAAKYDATNTTFSMLVGNAATGWTQTGVELRKETSTPGNQTLVIKLINPKKSADAVNANKEVALAVASNSFAAGATGAISSTPISLETAAKSANNDAGVLEQIGTAKIDIPAGVNALDASGNKINLTGRQITASTVKYGNGSAASMSAFPGGFTPTVVDQAGQTDSTGAFITGGFAQFNLTDSNGTAIKKFDKDVTLSIDLPKTSKQPDGTALKAGDTYPVWSYDEATGKWQFETNGLISEKSGDSDNFTVSFTSNHLSYWNLDFYARTCTGTLNLVRSQSDTRPLSVELVGVSGLRFYRTFYNVLDQRQIFARYPTSTQVNVVVRDEQNAVIARSTAPQNLCNTGTISIPAAPAVSRANLIVNVTESCPSGANRRASPTTVAFYDGRRWYAGYARSNPATNVASVSLDGLRSATQGTLYVYNPLTGRYQSQTVTVNAPSTTTAVNLPNLNCRVATGATGSTGNGN